MTSQGFIRPMPGKALVKLMGYYDRLTGPIEIPDMAKVRRKCEAKLIAFTQKPGAKNRVDLMNALNISAFVILKPYSGTQPFEWNGEKNLCIVRVDDIEAWSAEPMNAEHTEHSDGAVPRCKWCGPAKASQSSNAMMMIEGAQGYYCPRCLKDRNGNVTNPDAATLIDSDYNQINRVVEQRRKREKKPVTIVRP